MMAPTASLKLNQRGHEGRVVERAERGPDRPAVEERVDQPRRTIGTLWNEKRAMAISGMKKYERAEDDDQDRDHWMRRRCRGGAAAAVTSASTARPGGAASGSRPCRRS